jgi:hypothetical protein
LFVIHVIANSYGSNILLLLFYAGILKAKSYMLLTLISKLISYKMMLIMVILHYFKTIFMP